MVATRVTSNGSSSRRRRGGELTSPSARSTNARSTSRSRRQLGGPHQNSMATWTLRSPARRARGNRARRDPGARARAQRRVRDCRRRRVHGILCLQALYKGVIFASPRAAARIPGRAADCALRRQHRASPACFGRRDAAAAASTSTREPAALAPRRSSSCGTQARLLPPRVLLGSVDARGGVAVRRRVAAGGRAGARAAHADALEAAVRHCARRRRVLIGSTRRRPGRLEQPSDAALLV